MVRTLLQLRINQIELRPTVYMWNILGLVSKNQKEHANKELIGMLVAVYQIDHWIEVLRIVGKNIDSSL